MPPSYIIQAHLNLGTGANKFKFVHHDFLQRYAIRFVDSPKLRDIGAAAGIRVSLCDCMFQEECRKRRTLASPASTNILISYDIDFEISN